MLDIRLGSTSTEEEANTGSANPDTPKLEKTEAPVNTPEPIKKLLRFNSIFSAPFSRNQILLVREHSHDSFFKRNPSIA